MEYTNKQYVEELVKEKDKTVKGCKSGSYQLIPGQCAGCNFICPHPASQDWSTCKEKCPEVYEDHFKQTSTPTLHTVTTDGVAKRNTTSVHRDSSSWEFWPVVYHVPFALVVIAIVVVCFIVYKKSRIVRCFLDDLIAVFRRCGKVTVDIQPPEPTKSGLPRPEVTSLEQQQLLMTPANSAHCSQVIYVPADATIQIITNTATANSEPIPSAQSYLSPSETGAPLVHQANVHASCGSFYPIQEQAGVGNRPSQLFIRQMSSPEESTGRQASPTASPYGGISAASPYGGMPAGPPYGGMTTGSPYGGLHTASPYGGMAYINDDPSLYHSYRPGPSCLENNGGGQPLPRHEDLLRESDEQTSRSSIQGCTTKVVQSPVNSEASYKLTAGMRSFENLPNCRK